ncbi:MAG: ribosome silencing factor [Dehalococcoidia bacterium]|nr:ribosome silencing factor [Dehalococcoidia bacterium]
MEPLQLAREMVTIASDKQAEDIVLLDLRPLSTFAEFFVLMNAGSSRQLGAVADAIDEGLSKRGLEPRHREGVPDSGWVVLDYGAVVVHLFDPERREFYRLDHVWRDAPALVRIQ